MKNTLHFCNKLVMSIFGAVFLHKWHSLKIRGNFFSRGPPPDPHLFWKNRPPSGGKKSGPPPMGWRSLPTYDTAPKWAKSKEYEWDLRISRRSNAPTLVEITESMPMRPHLSRSWYKRISFSAGLRLGIDDFLRDVTLSCHFIPTKNARNTKFKSMT